MAEHTSLLSVEPSHTSIAFEQPVKSDDTIKHQQGPTWRPVSLRNATLLTFASVYTLMFVCLAVLAWISLKQHGVCAVRIHDRYWWTYGPTAIFTLVSLLWGQVDYRVRSTMPWILLQRAPTSAHRTILLDYVSPNLVLASFQSLKALDLPVILAVFGTILNKILVVLSTGLFLVDAVSITSSPIKIPGGKTFVDREPSTMNVTGMPAARVFGAYSLNIRLPFGTTLDYATEIPPFVDGDTGSLKLSSRVSVFYADLDCEIAHNTKGVVTHAIGEVVTQYQNEDGETVQASGDSSYRIVNGSKITYQKNPYMVETSDGGPTAYKLGIASDSCSQVLMTGESRGSLSPDKLLFKTPSLDCGDSDFRFVAIAPWSADLICKPVFTVKEATMDYSPGPLLGSNAWTLRDFSDVKNNRLSTMNGTRLYDGFQSSMAVSGDLSDLLEAVSLQELPDTLYQPANLLKAFRTLYVASVAQHVNAYLLSDSNVFEVTRNETLDRLQLRGYSLWITEAILLVLVIISLSLAWLSRQIRLPRDLTSLSGFATISSRSRSFGKGINGGGSASLDQIAEGSKSYLFHTATNDYEEAAPSFEIRQTFAPGEDLSIKEVAPKCQNTGPCVSWYRPLVVTITGRICIITITMILVISLAVLQRISDKEHGFVTFIDHDFSRYGWRFVPATTFVLVALAFGSLDMEMKTFQPFINLRNGPASSDLTVDVNYLNKIGIHALWIAARKKQYCIFATTTSVVISHFLTVLSSNLYTTEAAYHESSFGVRLSDHFALRNFTDIQNISYQKAGMMSAILVLDDRADLPQWTFDQISIPHLDSVPQVHPFRVANQVDVVLPGTRATANCTSIEPRFLNFTRESNDQLSRIDVRFDLPACGNISEMIGTSKLTTVKDANITGSFGYWLDRDSTINHCPQHLVIAGEWKPQDNKLDILALHCMPYLESVQIAVQLNHPTLQINRSHTPVINESTREFLVAIEVPGIGQHLLSPYQDPSIGSLGSVDGFFGTVIRQGQPLQNVLKDSATLQSVVEAMYSRILSQVLDQNRIPLSENTTVVGTLKEFNRIKLKQERGPAYALQALLSLMAICAAVTFLLGHTKNVLPKNPRSIAAMASLLAGSHLLDESIITPGSEWLTDEEWKERGLFEGMQFSMGWWMQDEEGPEGEQSDSEHWSGEARFGIDIGTARKNP